MEPFVHRVERAMSAFDHLEPALLGWFDAAGITGRPALVPQLVIEEWVRNVIEHGTGGEQAVEVRVRADGDEVVVEIVDDGDPFDPSYAPALDPDVPVETRGTRGMGVHLLRELTDELRYERRADGNHLVAHVQRAGA